MMERPGRVSIECYILKLCSHGQHLLVCTACTESCQLYHCFHNTVQHPFSSAVPSAFLSALKSSQRVRGAGFGRPGHQTNMLSLKLSFLCISITQKGTKQDNCWTMRLTPYHGIKFVKFTHTCVIHGYTYLK